VTDYGLPVQFGVFPTPEAGRLDEVLALARIADEEGLDLVGIQDHPYQRRFLDTWMLMATLLAKTQRVRVFPDVANLPLRPPAVMAKAAASLDVMSGGRFEFGLGAGSFWEAVVAMGGPRRSPGEAVEALSEAIEVVRLMWSDQRSVRFDGRHYRLAGVKPGPQPTHEIRIWLGVGGPRTLALLGRAADGWVPSSGWATPDKLAGMHTLIDEADADPADLQRLGCDRRVRRLSPRPGRAVGRGAHRVGGGARDGHVRVRALGGSGIATAPLRRRGSTSRPRAGRPEPWQLA
jgi:alkanesulfonate monooxygenase SsuD/methylene tetrahydromethanopterin reductase-like flavin-dependent oxidoreductase (luciferase family)